MEPTDPVRSEALSAVDDLVTAASRLQHALADTLSLSTNEAAALGYLARGGVDQTELGGLLGITSSSVTGMIDRLEQRGLAERMTDRTDRRRWLVRLTTTGYEAVEQFRAHGGRALDDVDTGSLPTVTRSLHTIADGLSREAARLTHRGRSRPG